MNIVKHATNEQILNSIILYCPYCTFNLNYNGLNLTKMLTHIRIAHIKAEFPISIKDSIEIHQETARTNNPSYYKNGFQGVDTNEIPETN